TRADVGLRARCTSAGAELMVEIGVRLGPACALALDHERANQRLLALLDHIRRHEADAAELDRRCRQCEPATDPRGSHVPDIPLQRSRFSWEGDALGGAVLPHD